jgi:hypothetical protein
MELHRFEVPIWDFIHYYAGYYSVDRKNSYTAASCCVWFYETIMDLPDIESFLIPVFNELNNFKNLRDMNEDGPTNSEEYDEESEYDEEVMRLINYHLEEYRYEFDVGSLGNEHHMIEEEDVVFELFLLLIAWIEMLGEEVDEIFRERGILEIRRMSTDVFVYTFA